MAQRTICKSVSPDMPAWPRRERALNNRPKISPLKPQQEFLSMTSIHSNPCIAILKHKMPTLQEDLQEEWIIHYTTPDHGFTALHEIKQQNSVSVVTEEISLENQVDIEIFTSRLTARGWTRVECHSRPRGAW